MTRTVINQNFVFGILFVIVGLVLASMKFITPVVAAVLNVVGSLFVVFNSARLVREGRNLKSSMKRKGQRKVSRSRRPKQMSQPKFA